MASPIRLTPAAAPVGLFTTPGVDKPGNQDSLIQLAQSLSALSGDVRQMLPTLTRWGKEDARDAVLADRAKLKIQNQKDFLKAVKSGELPAQNNPWYLSYMAEANAQSEARDSIIQLASDFESDPMRRSPEVDNLAAVGGWFDQRVQKLTDGKTAEELAAMAPVLEEGRSRFVTSIAAQRMKERPEEMAAAVAAEVATSGRNVPSGDFLAATASTPDPEAVARVNALSADFQSKLQRLGTVMPWPDANAAMSRAILAHAERLGSPEAAEQLLKGVKTTGGFTLLDTPGVSKALTDLRERIEYASDRSASRAETDSKRKSEKASNAALSDLMARYNASDKSKSFTEFAGPELMASIQADPEMGFRLGSMVKSLGNTIKDELEPQRNAQNTALLNALQSKDQTGTNAAVKWLVANGFTGDARLIMDTASDMDRTADVRTSQQTKVDVMLAAENGTLTLDRMFGPNKEWEVGADFLPYALEALQKSRATNVNPYSSSKAVQESSNRRIGVSNMQRIRASNPFATPAEIEAERLQSDNAMLDTVRNRMAAWRDSVPIEEVRAPGFDRIEAEQYQKTVDDVLKEAAGPAPAPSGPTASPEKAAANAATAKAMQLPEPNQSNNFSPTVGLVRDNAADINAVLRMRATGPVELADRQVYDPKIGSVYGEREFGDPYRILATVRQKYANPARAGGFEQTPHLVAEAQLEEIEAAKVASSAMVGMQRTVDKDGERALAIVKQARLTGMISPDDAREVRLLLDNVIRYGHYASNLPTPIEEVMKVPVEQRANVRVFVNALDIYLQGPEVATKLGIPREQVGAYLQTQYRLIPKQRNFENLNPAQAGARYEQLQEFRKTKTP